MMCVLVLDRSSHAWLGMITADCGARLRSWHATSMEMRAEPGASPLGSSHACKLILQGASCRLISCPFHQDHTSTGSLHLMLSGHTPSPPHLVTRFLHLQLAGLIIENTFTCVEDMAGKMLPPLALLVGTGRPLNFIVTNRWRNYAELGKVQRLPLLMVASLRVGGRAGQ